MTTYVKARRSHSMPSRFMMPSEDMGEYDDVQSRRRSAPSRPKGGLYPLREEGSYGQLPRAPPPAPKPLPGYQKKERKPKVYSSYALDNGCSVHSKKLAKSERDHGSDAIDHQRARRVSSSSSYRSSKSPGRRTVSASPARAFPSSSSSSGSSSGRNSVSPEPTARPTMRKNSGRLPGYSGKSWTTSSSSYSSRKYSAGNRYNGNLRDSSFEENEEYEYEENQRRNNNGGRPGGFGQFTEGIESKMSQISLDSMRKPKVNSWDSMGVLGLTTKIWNDTKKRQETFMESTGHFLREENTSSYIM